MIPLCDRNSLGKDTVKFLSKKKCSGIDMDSTVCAMEGENIRGGC